MLISPSDKGGFKIMKRIIAVRCVERGGSSFPVFFGGILDRVKGCVVTADSRAGKRWIGGEGRNFEVESTMFFD